MKTKLSLTNQIEDVIREVIEPLARLGMDAELNPNKIAKEVSRRLDPDADSPTLVSHLSIMHLRELVRKILARQFGTGHDPKALEDEGQQELFSGKLQQYYPVRRIRDGKRTSLYLQRDLMTREDAVRTHSKLKKLGESYNKHADDFMAWFEQKEEEMAKAKTS